MATLFAIRKSWPDKRLIVVFQPHRYTRTRDLYYEFTRSFYQSDVLVVLPIYAAGEKKIINVNARNLHQGIIDHGHKNAVLAEGKEAAAIYLEDVLRSGDILLTLGAGDVWEVGMDVLRRLDGDVS
jgi:UDP-N-acetylmuramate--alanine ligase